MKIRWNKISVGARIGGNEFLVGLFVWSLLLNEHTVCSVATIVSDFVCVCAPFFMSLRGRSRYINTDIRVVSMSCLLSHLLNYFTQNSIPWMRYVFWIRFLIAEAVKYNQCMLWWFLILFSFFSINIESHNSRLSRIDS